MIINFFMDFVNIVNYKIYMDKTKNNSEHKANITSDTELQEHKNRGIYLRDDHCDWGSSGMNEFTNEYGGKD